MSRDCEMLGEFADKGYALQSYPDALEIRYKGQSVAAYPIGTSKETIQAACQRHENRLNGVAGIPQ